MMKSNLIDCLVEETKQFYKTDRIRVLALKALQILDGIGVQSYHYSHSDGNERDWAIYADHIEIPLNILYWSAGRSNYRVNPFLWVCSEDFHPTSDPESWISVKISDTMKITARVFVENGFLAQCVSFDDAVFLRVLITQDEQEGLTAQLRFRDI